MSHDEDLLDIKQAARFLNVSEASLRRWTNSGRLACLRVGRRRERRFRREDLLMFAEEQPVAAAARSTFPSTEGSHVCGLYDSDLSRVGLAAAFLADALRPHSANYLAVEPDTRDQLLVHLARRRPSIQADVETGRLVFAEYAGSAAGQLAYWETCFAAATEAGARPVRVIGDVSSGLGRRLAPHEVLEYERNYDQLQKRFRVATLCLYDVRRSSGLELLDVLKCHGGVFQYHRQTDAFLAHVLS
jgi:excisionase family DNA binding protein